MRFDDNLDFRLDFRRFAASPLGTGLLLALVGLTVWVGLSVLGGIMLPEPGFRLREAWDTSSYFYAGLPVMAAAVALAAFLRPDRAWRWPLWLVTGHQVGVMLVGLGMQSAASLLILTILLAIMLAAIFTVPALLGALAARQLAR
jgi:hypothetical protein